MMNMRVILVILALLCSKSEERLELVTVNIEVKDQPRECETFLENMKVRSYSLALTKKP